MKRGEGLVIDARMFCHTEQSELVITLCVEQLSGDTRIGHDDFYLTLEEALILKKTIDELHLEEVR